MNTLFEAGVTYPGIDEKTGKAKQVKENYLVDAVSFTDVEARLHKHLAGTEYLNIQKIRKVHITEIQRNEEETNCNFYLAGINWTFVDERGKEAKNKEVLLVEATSTENASSMADMMMRNATLQFEVEAVKKYNIVEILN